MVQVDAEVTGIMLARALNEIHDQIASDGVPVRQDSSLPLTARRALSQLSAHCLLSGPRYEDLGSSVHLLMAMACKPFGDWGLPEFREPYLYADVNLIDPDNAVPTEDCRELARLGSGGEIALQEERHHERLQAAIKGLTAKQRSKAYTSLREFCVRNPAVTNAELHGHISKDGLIAAAQTLLSSYRPIPLGALFGGKAHRCAHCRSLLWPDKDIASYPDGRCRIRQCRLAHPNASCGEVIDRPADWRVAIEGVLAFWVGPGLDEIRIFDALLAKGLQATLYPLADAADVGLDGLKVGIDVKTYASPLLLGARLTRSIGRLATFERKIIAVPDDKLRLNKRYLEQLRASYHGAEALEFRTTGSVIEEFAG